MWHCGHIVIYGGDSHVLFHASHGRLDKKSAEDNRKHFFGSESRFTPLLSMLCAIF